MAATNAFVAPVKWAQRKDAIYVTIDLPDVEDEKVLLDSKNLTFTYVVATLATLAPTIILTCCCCRGTSNGQLYEVKLDFYKDVDVEATDSIWAKTARNVHFHIVKKERNADFWPRLLLDKALEKTNVKVDWSKFVDEDEDVEPGGFDMSALTGGGGFDMNQMMAAQNAGMMDEGSDSDEDEMPELDAAGQME